MTGYSADLMMESLPWARGFARSCAAKLPSHLDRDDMQSAGVVGYLKAAVRYDVTKGASFRGFCAVRIRGAVMDELRRWDWAPRSVYRNNRRITRVTIILMERLEREPTLGEVAEALGIAIVDLAALQRSGQPRQLVSFDDIGENSQGEETLSLMERLPDTYTPSPDSAVHSDENRRTLLRCMALLPKGEATVVKLHYINGMALREVAAQMEVTPSRISQLHHQALSRMRASWEKSEAWA